MGKIQKKMQILGGNQECVFRHINFDISVIILEGMVWGRLIHLRVSVY